MDRTSPQYFTIQQLLDVIEGENGQLCRQLYKELRKEFEASPGSSHNHQAWPGGYIDHVTDAMNVGCSVYELYNSMRPLPFSVSDVLLIVYLHDLEKPFRYSYNKGLLITSSEMPQKSDGESFKYNYIKRYGFKFSPLQQNALEFVEGIRDHKYRSDSRVMSELAVICHIADLTSARLWYNHPLAANDPWSGSKRVNDMAADITLLSEFTA